MRHRRFGPNQILFWVAAILCAYPAAGFSQIDEPHDEEYRVYDAVIARKFDDGTDFGSLSDGRILVIQDRTIRPDRSSDESDYARERIKPSAEALSDYRANHGKTVNLSRKFGTKSEYILFSRKAWESIFQPDGSYTYEDGWKRYYEKYPKSRGYIGFSRVGFNKSRSEAFLYFEHDCGQLCASGYFIALKKRSYEWSVKGIVMVWIS